MNLYYPVHYIKIIRVFQRHPSLRPFIIYSALEGYEPLTAVEIISGILLSSYLIEEKRKSWLGFLNVGTMPFDLT